MSDDVLRRQFDRLVAALPAPSSRVVDLGGAGRMWRATVWNADVALEIEMDRSQGPFVLLAKVGDERKPERGPCVNGSGATVRLHVGEALEESNPTLARDVRLLLDSWPVPNVEDGAWDELTDVCRRLWTVVEGRSWTDLRVAAEAREGGSGTPDNG